MSISLEPLFSTPLLRTKLYFDGIEVLKKNIIENHKNHISPNEELSVDTNVSLGLLDDKKFTKLKNCIEKKVSSTLYELYPVKDIEFYICDMWSTCSLPGEGGDHHFHANSFYSGVFYPFEKTPSGLILYSPVEDKFSLDITGNLTTNNQFCLSNYIIYPEQNELIFFPSYLYHKVLKNKSNITRYSIAFNVYLKGNLKAPTSSLNLL